MLLGFAALVIVTILFPATTSVVAELIGIGRGADLVFYMTSFAVMFLAAMVYLKFKKLEDRVASSLAIRPYAIGTESLPRTRFLTTASRRR